MTAIATARRISASMLEPHDAQQRVVDGVHRVVVTQFGR